MTPVGWIRTSCDGARPRAGHRQGFECEAPPEGRGALRCSVPWPRRELTARTDVRSVQTSATKSELEARCARWPWALRSSASHRRPGGDPPAALPTLAEHEAASLHTALHLPAPQRPMQCPAEDGGEANPGSKGGARSSDRAEDMDGFASPSASASRKHERRERQRGQRASAKRRVPPASPRRSHAHTVIPPDTSITAPLM